jgi:hypothetical protein
VSTAGRGTAGRGSPGGQDWIHGGGYVAMVLKGASMNDGATIREYGEPIDPKTIIA